MDGDSGMRTGRARAAYVAPRWMRDRPCAGPARAAPLFHGPGRIRTAFMQMS